MFKKSKLLRTLLSVWMTALLITALYLMTDSLLAGIIVAVIFVLYGICASLCQKGMDRMLGDEMYAVRHDLPKGAMRGKALLHASMVLSPFYFVYMFPSFIPIPSVYAWAMVQFAFIILYHKKHSSSRHLCELSQMLLSLFLCLLRPKF